MRRPKLIIAYTTAFALVLAGCDVNIAQTDLSAVTVANDRTTIEKALGKPDEVVEAQGFTVAYYDYDKGIFEPAPSGGGGSGCCSGGPNSGYALLGALVILAIVVPIDYAIRRSEASARQEGHLAAIFGADDKLVFAGSLEEPDPTAKKLTSLATRYQEAQSGNEAALIELSKVTLVPGQKKVFLETAANTGSAEAAYELGRAYEYGAGVAHNDAKAVEWWRKAVAGEYPPAQTELGKRYMYGTGVPRDIDRARVLLTKAANAGDGSAQTALASLDDAIEQDQPSGVILAQLQTAADDGDVKSQLELAERYRYGREVGVDLDQAIRWYVRAAVSGDDFAPYALGNIYRDGEAGAVNPSHAYMWYSIAARISSDDSEELDQRKRELTEVMSPTQIADADRLAGEWLEAHPQKPELAAALAQRDSSKPSSLVSPAGSTPTEPPKTIVARNTPDLDSSRPADTTNTTSAETSQLLADWQLRSDSVRSAISKADPIFWGKKDIVEFKIVRAIPSENNGDLVELETEYTAQEILMRAPFVPGEETEYQRIVVVDMRDKSIVRVNPATARQ